MVEPDRAPRPARRRADQPAAGLPRALKAAARRRDPHFRLRLGGHLVCARHQAAQGHDGLAVGPAWDEALSADRPVVFEALTDPEVPPLPPHITLEQAKALSSALSSGDPNASRIVKQSFKQKVQEFLPGR